MRAERTSVLLIELMSMLCVFVICAAVCLSIFAASAKLSKSSEQLNAAAILAQNTAEQWKSVGGDAARYRKLACGDRLYFSRDMAPAAEADAYYTLSLAVIDESTNQAEISVFADGKTVFQLKIQCSTEVNYEER